MSVKPKKDQEDTMSQRSVNVNDNPIINKSTTENNLFNMDNKSKILGYMQIIIALSIFVSYSISSFFTIDIDYILVNFELLAMSLSILFIYWKSFKKMKTKHKIMTISLMSTSGIFLLNMVYLLTNLPYKNYLSMFLGIIIIALSSIYFIINRKK